ncbi:hypothetical protein CEXT_437201 [Caerostris extrusa]|uniref:DEK-C domain-containing protein n=1 Tax=Caerostris extrusa TaxID=172846 RepID=A0AAV4RU59_CAEEX|nr:hypothetical protein CEXT_437201 [Caerostris extrusa]
MAFLNSLGYDISKRIAFLLGLCPFKADIAQQDLNELIMYFLMSPCKTKQVPIRHYPQTFFSKDVPKEICLLMQKHSDDASFMPINSTLNEQDSSQINQPESFSLSKPKKNSSAKSISAQQVLSPTPSTSTYLKTTQPLVLPGASDKIFLPALNQSPRPSLQNAIFKSPIPKSLPPACTLPQEYVFQQPTPDGQQKRYKLIKLPPGHPLSSAIKNPQQSSPVMPLQVQSNPISISSPLAINSPIISGQLPPGLILYKNPVVSASPTISNIVQTVPLVINQPAIKVNPPAVVPSTSREEIILPDIGKSVIPATYEGEGNIEKMHPVAEYPPTDEELFNSIQEVVHSSNFENMTLKNVIDQVTAQYSNFDMSHRHIFMKECVKKSVGVSSVTMVCCRRQAVAVELLARMLRKKSPDKHQLSGIFLTIVRHPYYVQSPESSVTILRYNQDPISRSGPSLPPQSHPILTVRPVLVPKSSLLSMTTMPGQTKI